MKNRFAVIAACGLLSAMTLDAGAASPLLITETIDAEKVTQGLALHKHKIGKSGNGRKRQRWSIRGLTIGELEIIGNNQSDADILGMRCMEFKKNGDFDPPITKSSSCRQNFVKLLSNFTTTPEWFAEKLIAESIKSGATEYRQLGDLYFDYWEGFYSVRRVSRMR